jgi:H+/Cl- antiporter ClcA
VLTAGFLSLALFGNYSYFPLSGPELVLNGAWRSVLLCALISGIAGGLFSRTLIRGLPGVLPHRFRTLPGRHPIYAASFCGLVVAILGWLANGTTYGTGYEQAAAMLNGDAANTLWFGVAKWTATVLSYFAGIPGGIFTPSLSIGAGIGAYLDMVFPGISDPRMLVLLSMAAFLAAATEAPITASVIAMEMTKGQDVMLYLLAATLIASYISRLFTRRPFYHAVARNFRREALSIEEAENRKNAAGSRPTAA